MLKGIRFFILFFILTLIVSGFAMHVFSQDKPDWRGVSFATQPNILKFFDQESGKVYVYSEVDGRLMAVWGLEELGQDLKQIVAGKNY